NAYESGKSRYRKSFGFFKKGASNAPNFPEICERDSRGSGEEVGGIRRRNTHDEMDKGLAHQEPEFNEETEWAALPEEDDEAENWLSGSEWAPLSDDEEDEPEVTVIRMETSGVEEPEEIIREILVKS
uniref:DUF1604 domain-containing protein n=1 Tax=Loa loa TaxID=7209 RepID=A0A1I7VTF8_LOALO